MKNRKLIRNKGTLLNYQADLERLKSSGISVKTTTGGSVARIEFGCFVWLYGEHQKKERVIQELKNGSKKAEAKPDPQKTTDEKFSEMVGKLCRMVRTDAKRWMRATGYNEKESPGLLYFNMKSIPFILGQNCIFLDLKACHWNIAFKLGVISEKTYKTGLPDESDPYKLPRNKAIGYLAKVSKVTESGGEPKMVRSITSPAYHAVINRVFQIMEDVKRFLNGDLIMWLSDCCFILPRSEPIVKAYFDKLGLQYSSGFVKFTDLSENVIHWEKKEGGEVISKSYRVPKILMKPGSITQKNK